jgi:hypothetical protein
MIDKNFSYILKFLEAQSLDIFILYPIIQLYFELDNFIDGNNININKIVIYSFIFVFIISIKYIRAFSKWKKENPDEWESVGRPSLLGKEMGPSEEYMKSQEKQYDTKTTGKLGFQL